MLMKKKDEKKDLKGQLVFVLGRRRHGAAGLAPASTRAPAAHLKPRPIHQNNNSKKKNRPINRRPMATTNQSRHQKLPPVDSSKLSKQSYRVGGRGRRGRGRGLVVVGGVVVGGRGGAAVEFGQSQRQLRQRHRGQPRRRQPQRRRQFGQRHLGQLPQRDLPQQHQAINISFLLLHTEF